MRSACDILVIGGPSISVSTGPAHGRQIPFTFSGLAEAYGLLPSCTAILYCPDKGIFETFPSGQDLDAFDRNQPLVGAGTISRLMHPIMTELGLISDGDERPITDQIASNLETIAADEPRSSGFVERAVTAFVLAAVQGLYNVVRHGGLVVICVPEDFPSWTPKQQLLLYSIIPGLRVVVSSRWTDHLQGATDLKHILPEDVSPLLFGQDVDNTPLFRSDLVPSDAHVVVLPGVQDRNGGHRLMEIAVDDGRILVCPLLAWDGVLEYCGIVTGDAARGVTPGLTVDARPTMVAQLPQDPATEAAWDEALGWSKPHGNRINIKSVRDLAQFIDAVVQRGHAKTSDSLSVDAIGREISVDSVRQIFKRKPKALTGRAPDDPLVNFFEKAKTAFRKCVTHT